MSVDVNGCDELSCCGGVVVTERSTSVNGGAVGVDRSEPMVTDDVSSAGATGNRSAGNNLIHSQLNVKAPPNTDNNIVILLIYINEPRVQRDETS